MYNYKDMAKANVYAAVIITRCKDLVYDLSKEYSSEVGFMHDLSVVDKLEENWQRGRYLSFICNLRDINVSLIKYFKTSARYKLNNFNAFGVINFAINAMNAYENTLFEFMSSRGDASFCVNKDLYKITYALRTGLSDTNPEMQTLIQRFIAEREKYNLKDIGLLSIMATHIELADWLTKIEESEDSPEIRELHAALEDAGVYSRWRNF